MEHGPPSFEVIILGSGTCVPSLARSPCAVLLRIQKELFLLDCGPGTMRRLLEAGFSVFDITQLGISHLHPDHSGELVSFLFANKYPSPARREQALTLIGGCGFTDFFSQLQGIYGEWIDLAGGLELLESESSGTGEKSFSGFRLCTAPVNHRPESIAFRIAGPGGKTLVYSGDTDYCENLIRLAEHADLLICEAALPEGQKAEGHLTPSLAGEIAARAGVRHLVLTHFYPPCDQADIAGQCRKTYSGPLILAQDLLRFSMDGL
ncbi:MAG: MBL fold metallo-hydrolase [Desulfosalsimonadaceae bacterium]